MSETTTPSIETDAGACATEVISDKPPKPAETTKSSGIRPPSVTAAKSRIGRPCMHSTPKPALPPQQNESNMRRQSEEFNSRSHLSDVCEESEPEMVSDRSPRSTVSRSPDRLSSIIGLKGEKKISTASTNSDLYLEATGRRRSSDHGTVLTTDTDSFIIGQRIWVSGQRPGHIAYIGETHFAPGEWAGVVLDDPSGKNDGCVAGKRYFQCEPKRGIFSRLTRLTREPLPIASSNSDVSLNISATRSTTSPSAQGSVSPTQSVKSFMGRTPTKNYIAVGDRVIVSSGLGSRPGILKYMGETKFAPGNWCGVQLDEPTGKNNGTVDDVSYFECPPQCGIFVPLAKVTLSPSSRKARLSRAGSTESINSVGTIDSVVSTATSRMRAGIQRTSLKTPTSTIPKNTFSLQDVLREKQNHIEQLLLERDLDRHDSESQSIDSQRTINHLKEQVTQLEKNLDEEKKKAEDLQFSIDEATYCGDDNSLQAQAFKNRISQLEFQLNAISSKKSLTSIKDGQTQTDEITRLQLEIQKLNGALETKTAELQQTAAQLQKLQSEHNELQQTFSTNASDSEFKLTEFETSNEALRKDLENLTQQLTDLQSGTTQQNDAKSIEIENLKVAEQVLNEKIINLKNELTLRDAIVANYDGELKDLISDKEVLEKRCQEILGAETTLRNQLTEKCDEIQVLKYTEIAITDENAKLLKRQEELETKVTEHSEFIGNLQKIIDDKSAKCTEFEKTINKLQEDAAARQQSITEQTSTISKLESEANSFKSKCDEYAENLKQSECQRHELIESLKNDKDMVVTQLNQNIESLRTQLTELSQAKTNTENELAARNDLIVTQKSTIEQLETKCVNATTETNNSAQEIDSLTHTINQKNESLQLFEEKLTSLSSSHETVQHDFNQIKEQCNAKDETISALQQKIVKFEEEFSNLKTVQSNDASQSSQKIQELLHELETAKNEHDSLTKQIEQAKQNLLDNQDALNTSAGQFEETSTQLTDAVKKISQLESELMAKGNDVDTVTKQNEEMAVKLESSNQREIGLQSQLSALTVDHDEIGKEKSNALQKINQLENELIGKVTDFEKIVKHNEELAVKLESGSQRETELQTQLSKLQVDHADLGRKMTVLEQKVEQVNQEKQTLQQTIEALQNTSSDTNSEIVRLSEQLNAKQKQLDETIDSANTIKLNLEKSLHETTQNLDARTAQYERLCNEIEQLTAHKVERENELNSELSRMKETADAERQLLIETNENLEKSFRLEKATLLADIDARLSQSDTTKAELNESLAKLEDQVKQLSEAVERGKTELRAKENDFNVRVSEWTSLESSLRQELDSCKQLEESTKMNMAETLRISESINQDLTVQLESHKNENSALQAEINDLKAKLEDVSSERQSLEEVLKNTENDKESLNSSASEMRSKFSEMSAKFRSLEDEQVDLVDRNEQLIAQLKEATEKIVQLTDSCTAKEQQLTQKDVDFNAHEISTKNLYSAMEQQLLEAHQKRVDNETTMNALNNQLNELNAKLDCKSNEFSKLEESLATTINVHQTNITETNERLKTIETNAQELQTQLNARDETIQCLEKKIAETTVSADNVSADLKIELANRDSELKTKELNISQLNETIEVLKTQINAQEARMNEIINEKTVENQRSLNELAQKMDEIKLCQLNVSDLETKLSQKDSELLAAKLEYTKTNTELQEEINRRQETHLQEIAKLSDCRSEYDSLQCAFTKFEQAKKDEIIELTKKLSDIDAENAKQADALKRMEKFKSIEQQLQQEKIDLKAREAKLMMENQIVTERVMQLQNSKLQSNSIDDDTDAQISFLNSIIADMQKKNETLSYRIEALEAAPSDMVNNVFDVQVKRKPAPRMFCDICDIFDAHETEDCPLQSSDSPPPPPAYGSSREGTDIKERVLPPPRKYCEICEQFDHDTNDCPNDETY